jgi:hypothetical protein
MAEPGIVLTGYLIQQAIEDKRAMFDFARQGRLQIPPGRAGHTDLQTPY